MSNNNLMLDVGQANELKLTFRRAGYTNNLIKKLCTGDILSKVKEVLIGISEIKHKLYLVDSDAEPYNPDITKYFIEEHIKGGKVKFSTDMVELFLLKEQQEGLINGKKVYKQLKGKIKLNANVLDFLLDNPEIIPDNWKYDKNGNIRHIGFWGTIYDYRFSTGKLLIRYLFWHEYEWTWGYSSVDANLGRRNPAAILKVA